MLEDTLKDLHQNIKLGASGGGFIYCGNSDSIDYFLLDRRSIKKMSTYLQTCKTAISRLRKKMVLPETDYDQRMTLKRHIKENEEKIDMIVHEMLNYKKISERKVLATYPSIDEKDTLIIIIEGNEVGSAWTTSEYERRCNEGVTCR